MTLFHAWERGITLQSALDRSMGGRAWSAAHDQVLGRFQRLRTDPRSPLADRLESLARMQSLGEAWEEQTRLLDAARQAMVARLARAELAAIGFLRDEPFAPRLAPVPVGMWAGDIDIDIDWQASTMTGRGFAFADLRVVEDRRALSAEASGALTEDLSERRLCSPASAPAPDEG